MDTLIIISTIKFQDNKTAGAARMKSYAKAIAKENVRVILASFLEYDSTALLKKYDHDSNIFYFNSLKPRNDINYRDHKSQLINFFNRLLLLVNNNFKVSFLLYPSSYITFDIAALFYLKKIKKSKIFYEVNEVRKYSVSYLGEKFKINYYKHHYNEYLTKYFDGLICISTNIREYYIKFNDNVIIIPILSDLAAYDPNIENSYDGKNFNIGFTGSISIQKENLEIFFNAISKVVDKNYNIILNLYGIISEDELRKIDILLKRQRISKNVIYHGRVNHDEILAILRKQHLLVLPRGETLQNKYGFSTKLSEYLVSGIPVLLTDVSDNLRYLKDGEDVIVVNADDSNDIALKMMQLIDSYNDVASILSRNAIKSARKYFDYLLYKEKLKIFFFK